MSNTFDPYHTWLGIAPAEQPPNHYRLLGIALFEESRDVISNAADRQMAHIRTFQGGKHSAESQKLLNELSAARVTLLDPKKRADYDAKLRAKLYPPAPVTPPPYQMGMGQQMPPQQMGMGGVPVPPPAPPARPMPPAPPAPPAPPILGASSTKPSVKKHSHSNDDSTKLYIVIGVIAVAIIALAVMISSGSKEKPEIAQTTNTSNEDNGTINPEEFSLDGDEETFPERSVQEHILDDSTPGEKKPVKEKPAPKTDVEVEKPATTTPAAKAESADEVKDDSAEDTEKTDAQDAEDDADAEASEDTEKTKETEETTKEKPVSKPEKDSSEPKTKEKTDSGIPDDEIKKLGTGISLWMEPKREKMLKFYGANDQVQPEIMQAVEWLNDKMIRNSKLGVNYWSFDHSQAKKGAGYKKVQNPGLAKQNYISATSLSLMAIFGSGQIDQKEKQNFAKAINFLMYNAKPASDEQVLPANYEHAKKLEASLVIEENENAAFHPHAWGTTAVCNYIAISREMNDRKEKNLELYEVFAKALVRHIVRQQNLDGGFPAVERGLNVDCMLKTKRADHTSAIISTVWNLIALQAAKAAEVPVPKETIENANDYLAKAIKRISAGHKNFVGLTKSEVREIRTALFGIQIFGDDFPTYAESAYLLELILAEYDESQLQENFICTMYARDLRGDSWKNWRKKVLGPYLKAQATDKLEKGSWYFAGEVVNDEGGRLYCTALTTLILESFYRNAPTRPLDEWENALEPVVVPTPAAAPAATPAAAPAATPAAAAAKEEAPQESFLGEGQELELSTGDDDDDDDDE
ncbi:MAG: hypothetical protein IJK97_08225 [Thermoguttaceae bacterium]|nr:hypothetical protein [Thermoguttaceae bacterium]MBR0192956.1 hypothetical protein [Thermoguttaceae bacterium]